MNKTLSAWRSAKKREDAKKTTARSSRWSPEDAEDETWSNDEDEN